MMFFCTRFFALLVPALSLAQSQALLDRISEEQVLNAQVQHYSRLHAAIRSFEAAELKDGRSRVAEQFVNLMGAITQDRLKAAVSSLSDVELQRAFDQFKVDVKSTGSKDAKRALRALGSETELRKEPRKLFQMLLDRTTRASVEQSMHQALAQHQGSVSQMLRSIDPFDSRAKGVFGIFGVTRDWIEYCVDEKRSDYWCSVPVGAMFASLFVVPLSVTLDVLVLPITLPLGIINFFGDIFTTTPEEKTLSDLNAENQALKREIEELKRQSSSKSGSLGPIDQDAMNRNR